LLSGKWVSGVERNRWTDIYVTKKGAVFCVDYTQWQGEVDSLYLPSDAKSLLLEKYGEDKDVDDFCVKRGWVPEEG